VIKAGEAFTTHGLVEMISEEFGVPEHFAREGMTKLLKRGVFIVNRRGDVQARETSQTFEEFWMGDG
jgi:DNA-binding transcriptional regulator PaaX